MKIGLTFLAIAFVGIVYAQNEHTSENKDSLLNQSLARFIKSDYTNWDSLKTNSEQGLCVMIDTVNELFTGIAYKIEYGKDFWFLNEGSPNNDVRLKIMSFVKGLRNGVALVIDPLNDFDFLSPHAQLRDMVVDEAPDMVRMQMFNETPVSEVKKDLVFRFQDFEVEYFDVSAMVRFEFDECFSMDGTKLLDFELWELVGFEDISLHVALDEYKNKYLHITLTSGYGRNEQFGHYETDHSRLYYEVPPYNCGPNTTISKVEVLENFKPAHKE